MACLLATGTLACADSEMAGRHRCRPRSIQIIRTGIVEAKDTKRPDIQQFHVSYLFGLVDDPVFPFPAFVMANCVCIYSTPYILLYEVYIYCTSRSLPTYIRVWAFMPRIARVQAFLGMRCFRTRGRHFEADA